VRTPQEITARRDAEAHKYLDLVERRLDEHLGKYYLRGQPVLMTCEDLWEGVPDEYRHIVGPLLTEVAAKAGWRLEHKGTCYRLTTITY